MASNVKNSNLIVGLDIGTSKVVCIVGKYNETNDLEIVALGSYPSSGLKRGIVVNIDATTDAIKKAVDQAQSMIDEKIKNVFVGIAGNHVKSLNSHGTHGIKDNEVSNWDLEKVNSDNTVTLVKKEFNGIFQGFLGYSEKKGKNVSTLIAERMHISIFFGFTSLILVYLICIPLGILKALKHGKRFDVLSSIIVFTGYSIPGYALGVLLLSYFGGDIFPLHGWRSPDFSELSLWGKIKDQIHHAFLPIVCYMVGSFATMTVLMKNSLMENLNQDYVRTAFAKGLSEKRVIFFHAVRNSLIPLATGIGSSIGIFLAGSYLIEKTFGIDGIGLLGFNALIDKDYSIMMGALAIQVVILLIGNLISDITYAIIDPRIRFK